MKAHPGDAKFVNQNASAQVDGLLLQKLTDTGWFGFYAPKGTLPDIGEGALCATRPRRHRARSADAGRPRRVSERRDGQVVAFKGLVADFDRAWPKGVTRTRDKLNLAEERSG